jgi:hypothetical protein
MTLYYDLVLVWNVLYIRCVRRPPVNSFDSYMVLMPSLAYEVLTEIGSESFKLAVSEDRGYQTPDRI